MTAPNHSIELMRLMTGAWAARLVHTAAELGIADHLAGGPRGVDFLAAQIGAHIPSLARLLRALTAIGVLHEAIEQTENVINSERPPPAAHQLNSLPTLKIYTWNDHGCRFIS